MNDVDFLTRRVGIYAVYRIHVSGIINIQEKREKNSSNEIISGLFFIYRHPNIVIGKRETLRIIPYLEHCIGIMIN